MKGCRRRHCCSAPRTHLAFQGQRASWGISCVVHRYTARTVALNHQARQALMPPVTELITGPIGSWAPVALLSCVDDFFNGSRDSDLLLLLAQGLRERALPDLTASPPPSLSPFNFDLGWSESGLCLAHQSPVAPKTRSFSPSSPRDPQEKWVAVPRSRPLLRPPELPSR